MRNEGNICDTAWGCCAITSLSLGQKYIKLGIVRVTLYNTKLH